MVRSKALPAKEDMSKDVVSQPLCFVVPGSAIHECEVRLFGCGYTWIDAGSVAYRLGPNSVAKSATYVTIEDGLPSVHYMDCTLRCL